VTALSPDEDDLMSRNLPTPPESKSPRQPGLAQRSHEAPVSLSYDLDGLIAGIMPETLHPEIDWGRPMGKEC
jgi:hypothetical protein